MDDLTNKLEKIKHYLNNDLKDDVGIQAKNFFKKSFRDEGFTDKKLVKWKEVKRRQDTKNKGASSKRKILTGSTKQLHDSIDYQTTNNGVALVSDMIYAEINNEGGKAGRNGSAVTPKRQFIGESDTLNKMITTNIQNEITDILTD